MSLNEHSFKKHFNHMRNLVGLLSPDEKPCLRFQDDRNHPPQRRGVIWSHRRSIDDVDPSSRATAAFRHGIEIRGLRDRRAERQNNASSGRSSTSDRPRHVRPNIVGRAEVDHNIGSAVNAAHRRATSSARDNAVISSRSRATSVAL